MAKTVLVGKEKEKQQQEKKKQAKANGRKKRRSPIRFIKDIWGELKKVVWPTRKELINYTLAVFVFVGAMAIVAGLFDFGLRQLLNLVVVNS